MPSLGEIVPDFDADSSLGPINFYKYIEGKWAILFSHPADFTPVCTTELGEVGRLQLEFEKRGVVIMALSCNDASTHQHWLKDIEAFTPGCLIDWPIIADPERRIAIQWNMLDPAAKDDVGIPLSARAVFIIGPDKRLKLSICYPATTGRNFYEVLRAIDSLQLTEKYSVATPVNWRHGDACMVVPSISDHDASRLLPKGFERAELPSGKGYIRITPQPNI
eukprot:jgi/Botrbrau1/7201/Bobra.0300s0027.1